MSNNRKCPICLKPFFGENKCNCPSRRFQKDKPMSEYNRSYGPNYTGDRSKSDKSYTDRNTCPYKDSYSDSYKDSYRDSYRDSYKDLYKDKDPYDPYDPYKPKPNLPNKTQDRSSSQSNLFPPKKPGLRFSSETTKEPIYPKTYTNTNTNTNINQIKNNSNPSFGREPHYRSLKDRMRDKELDKKWDKGIDKDLNERKRDDLLLGPPTLNLDLEKRLDDELKKLNQLEEENRKSKERLLNESRLLDESRLIPRDPYKTEEELEREREREEQNRELLFYQLPLNLDFLTQYLKKAEENLNRSDANNDLFRRFSSDSGGSDIFKLDDIRLELPAREVEPPKPKCCNPLCNHLTPEEDPTEINVPEFTNIDSIDQIIEIAETFHCQKNKMFKGIDMEKMYGLVEPLRELQGMIGLKEVKTKIVEQILYFIKNFQDEKNRDMMHTVITGPPGTGKTTFARILGKVYSKLGLVSKGHFVEVTREDLVGKYLGHTAPQTNKTIEKCKGGIMFIDEVYSLGHSEKRDSFSKEAIDVLNQKLSENRDMLCIIAGYQEDIEKCFFNQNKGLKRRFPFVYDIEGYNNEEMLQIFKQKIRRDKWEVEDDVVKPFTKRFDKNIFKYFGGDIETFVFKTKIAFAQTHFYQEERKIDKLTLEKAFKLFEDSRKDKERELPYPHMYL